MVELEVATVELDEGLVWEVADVVVVELELLLETMLLELVRKLVEELVFGTRLELEKMLKSDPLSEISGNWVIHETSWEENEGSFHQGDIVHAGAEVVEF